MALPSDGPRGRRRARRPRDEHPDRAARRHQRPDDRATPPEESRAAHGGHARARDGSRGAAPAGPAALDPGGLEPGVLLDLLACADLEVVGRLVEASNITLYGSLRPPERMALGVDGVACVYKPVRGERPLWDFPRGTLSSREVAAFVLSAATGWDIVPPTVWRDGPFGPGMVQLWIEADPDADVVRLIRTGAPPLRRMALFDAVANNADRKGGHLLPVRSGHVYGVDHGICFHTEPKLRTILWGWRGTSLGSEERTVLERLLAGLGGELGRSLGGLLAREEIAATRRRIEELLAAGCFPEPDPERPAIPWPPF